jgi:hypothetical protein
MTLTNDANNGPLDLTGEPNLATSTALPAPSIQSVRIDDLARILLAFVLVGLLAFVIIITAIYAVANPKLEPTIESYLKIVLSPIIGIVGSVVGFYFGARSASRGS